MFSFTFYDFDRTVDTRTLQALTRTVLQHHPECTFAIAPTKKDLVNFISKLEYKTSGQYPSEADVEDIKAMIEKI